MEELIENIGYTVVYGILVLLWFGLFSGVFVTLCYMVGALYHFVF